MATVKEIPYIADENDKASVWYQPEDFEAIRKDIDATVLELIQIEEDMRYWDTSTYTLRGIEQRFSRRYRSQRRAVQKRTVRMVLRAQREYGHKGDDAHQQIQRLSRLCSKAARTRAQEVGALDQFAAGLGRPTRHQPPPKPVYLPMTGASTARRPSFIAQQA